MAIRDLNKKKIEGKHAKLHDSSITQKEFGKDDNNGQDSMQWHNREKDWYNAERRFIFSSPDPKMLKKWITLIQKDKKRIEARINSEKNTMIGLSTMKSMTPGSTRSGGKRTAKKRFGDRVMKLTQRTETDYGIRDFTPVKEKADLSTTSGFGNIVMTGANTNISMATLATGAGQFNESIRVNNNTMQDNVFLNSNRSS